MCVCMCTKYKLNLIDWITKLFPSFYKVHWHEKFLLYSLGLIWVCSYFTGGSASYFYKYFDNKISLAIIWVTH